MTVYAKCVSTDETDWYTAGKEYKIFEPYETKFYPGDFSVVDDTGMLMNQRWIDDSDCVWERVEHD